MDRQRDAETDALSNTDGFNRTKGERPRLTAPHHTGLLALVAAMTLARVSSSPRDVQLRALGRLCGRSVLRPVPDRQTVPADPGGGRGLPAARLQQAAQEAGTLRLRRGADLRRREPGGVGKKQGPGGVPAPPQPEDSGEFWEEEEDGRDELLTCSSQTLSTLYLYTGSVCRGRL